jgi:hypothetical protein
MEASGSVIVSVHNGVDSVHLLRFAFLWLEDKDVVVSNVLGLLVFIRPNSEIAKIFLDVNAGPLSVLADLSCEICKRHSMSIP